MCVCVSRPSFVTAAGICLTLPYLRTTLPQCVVGGAGSEGVGGGLCLHLSDLLFFVLFHSDAKAATDHADKEHTLCVFASQNV